MIKKGCAATTTRARRSASVPVMSPALAHGGHIFGGVNLSMTTPPTRRPSTGRASSARGVRRKLLESTSDAMTASGPPLASVARHWVGQRFPLR